MRTVLVSLFFSILLVVLSPYITSVLCNWSTVEIYQPIIVLDRSQNRPIKATISFNGTFIQTDNNGKAILKIITKYGRYMGCPVCEDPEIISIKVKNGNRVSKYQLPFNSESPENPTPIKIPFPND